MRRNVTVSGFQAGKQEIFPADQIPEVDSLWCEMFPELTTITKVCPSFKHFKDQYESNPRYPDVTSLKDLKKCPFLRPERVIVAGPYWNSDESKLEAKSMISISMYNGVQWVDTKWDGTIKSAIESHLEHIDSCTEKEKYTPNDDWLSVTVDYHS